MNPAPTNDVPKPPIVIDDYSSEHVPLGDWKELFLSTCRRVTNSRTESEFGLLAWSQFYLPHYFRLPPSRMHVWLGKHLEHATDKRGVKLNLIGPRGSAKSTVATLAYVLQCAVEQREEYIWILSDTKHQAAMHLANVRAELKKNKLLKHSYPQAFCEAPITQGNAIQLSNGVTIEAYGAGQHVRGKRSEEHRPSLIVCDDLQNENHIASALQRGNSRNWFQGTLLKAGTKLTNIVNLATALHHDALAMELHRTPGWTSKIFRAIEHWPKNMHLWSAWEEIYANLHDPEHLAHARDFYQEHADEMHAGVKLLWPEEEDLYTLMCMRVEGGRTAFEREKQGSPFDPSLCEWPEEYFDAKIWFDDWPSNLQVRVIALDPSKGSDARYGDYSAFVKLGVSQEGILYVEADLARRATPQMVADGVELCREFRPHVFGIESNQYQDLLQGEFAVELQRQRIQDVRPWPVENRVNKMVRIRRLGPHLSTRRLRFKASSPGTKLLVQQLRDFPTGDFDDGPDALEMAVRLASEMLTPRPNDGLGNRLRI